MTATGQEKAKGDQGSEPKVEKPAAEPKEPKTVPLGEFIEMRQKMQELRDELASMKAASAPSEKKPEPAAPQTPAETDELRKRVAKMEEQRHIDELVRELSLTNKKQAELVSQTLARNPDLSPAEALAHAAKREPDIFKDREQAEAAKAAFSSLRPTSGSRPEPKQSDFKQRVEHVRSLQGKDKRQMNAYIRDICANAAARAAGLDYEQLQLPQQ